MIEIPYLKNMVFERRSIFVDLFSMAFGLPGVSISNDIVGGQHQMRERNASDIGPSEAAQRRFLVDWFCWLRWNTATDREFAETAPGHLEEFLGMQSTLGLLGGELRIHPQSRHSSVISRWWFQRTFFSLPLLGKFKHLTHICFRLVEPTRFVLDLRWLVIADFKLIWYAMGFSSIWGICLAFSRHLKDSIWYP